MFFFGLKLVSVNSLQIPSMLDFYTLLKPIFTRIEKSHIALVLLEASFLLVLDNLTQQTAEFHCNKFSNPHISLYLIL